jgi:hypothetical protein
MRIANLGTHRSQNIKDKISKTRSNKVWEYAKTPSPNPSIGDKARINNHSCIYASCNLCGAERWVRVKRGGIPSHNLCLPCTSNLPEQIQLRKFRELGRKHSPERVEKNRSAHLGQVVTEEGRVRRRRNWDNPEWREWAIKQHISPHKPEKQLSELLEDIYPTEWKFVGNGSLIINGLNPDFANINGKKLLMEMYGDYWHKNDNPADRIKLFAKYGYNTLIIWERDLRNTDKLREKIQEFVCGY